MNRAAIRAYCAQFLKERTGTEGAGDPFLYDQFINLAADEIAQRTDCLFGTATADIVANQGAYCAANGSPLIYRYNSICWIDAQGNKNRLNPVTIAYLDQQFPYWRSDQASSPQYAAVLGENQIQLYPTPDTSLSGGLVIDGWAKPARSWDADSAECPIPGGDTAHWAIIWRVCQLRALEFGDIARSQVFEQEYRKAKGLIERATHKIDAAHSHADTVSQFPAWSSD